MVDFIVLRVVGQPVVGKPVAQQSMPHATAAQATWIREAAAGGTWPSGQFKRRFGFQRRCSCLRFHIFHGYSWLEATDPTFLNWWDVKPNRQALYVGASALHSKPDTGQGTCQSLETF